MTADDTWCLHSSHERVIKWTFSLPVARQGVVAPNFQADSDVMNRQGQAGWVGLYKLRKNASEYDFRRDVYSKSANHSFHCDVALMASQNGGDGTKKKTVCDKNKQNFFFIEWQDGSMVGHMDKNDNGFWTAQVPVLRWEWGRDFVQEREKKKKSKRHITENGEPDHTCDIAFEPKRCVTMDGMA